MAKTTENNRRQITKSKIVCTLGPSSSTPDMIGRLAKTGMDVARLNFSHGTKEYKENLFRTVRETVPELAIMCDIQGPKIRIGNIKNEGATLVPGARVVITTEEIQGDASRFTISYKEFPREAKPGDRVYINDGIVCIEVQEVMGEDVVGKVLAGGFITSKKGVNLPNTDISMRVPTEKDVADLEVIAKLDPEYVAISFVQDAQDVRKVRKLISGFGNDDIKLVSKIERPIALKNFDEILKESDGIMVARGDLGVEVPFERIIPAQKEMIKKCNTYGKPIIVATQMLESMVNAPVPTRAEVSDVYNAIEDGADAVMLSAETAAGKYPVEAVSAMERIIKVSEAQIPPRNPDDFDSSEETVAEIIGHLVHSACKEFDDINVEKIAGSEPYLSAKILCLTHTGLSARMVSKYRPTLPILAVTSQERTAREMRLVWGVEPVFIDDIEQEMNTFVKIQQATRFALDAGLVDDDEHLICVGNMFYLPSRTNMVSIFAVKDIVASMNARAP